jgi:hypothetical protein
MAPPIWTRRDQGVTTGRVRIVHASMRSGFVEERELTRRVHVPESGRSSECEWVTGQWGSRDMRSLELACAVR